MFELHGEGIVRWHAEVAGEIYQHMPTMGHIGKPACIINHRAQSGLGKADLILDRDDAWARSAMARREAWDHPRLGRVWVLSLEDLILAKLESSGGISELQLRDCANLLRTNAPAVNWSYLERYADVLGVEQILARLRAASA